MYLLVNVQDKLCGTQVGGYKHGPRYLLTKMVRGIRIIPTHLMWSYTETLKKRIQTQFIISPKLLIDTQWHNNPYPLTDTSMW